MISIMKAIKAINPIAECTVINEDINQIIWNDNTTPISKEDILAASKIKDELEKLSNERESEKFGDNDIDLKYLKKMQQANK